MSKTNAVRLLDSLEIKFEVFDPIAVSAGVRVTLIMLSPQDYLEVAKGI